MKSQIVRPKIILADDHPVMRRGMVMLVGAIAAKLGINPQIDEVSGGVDLVKRVCSGNYQIAFTDISMPDLNGLEAIRQIRATRNKTPIYACSTHDSDTYEIPTIQAGATGYIQKGTQRDEKKLEEALRAHLL